MTLFHKRWKCFNLSKREDEDYLTFASIVKKRCDDFRLAELSAVDFKCLIFAQVPVSAKNSEIRLRVLSKLENEPGLTLQKLAEDCQRVVSVKNDSKNIDESGVAYVRRTNYKPKNYAPGKNSENKNSCVSTPTWSLYKFERLAFGVKVAHSIFQQVMDTMLDGLDFACAYLDDIVVACKSTEEHCRQIHEVFERIHNFGFRIK